MKNIVGMILVAMAAAMPARAFELTDARAVAIPENAWESTRLAATEFTNYVSKATGAALQVKVKGEGEQRTDCSVVIGILGELGDKVPDEARKALEATDNFEAAWTGVRNGRLWIIGKEDVAELFATYRFLEKHLGVRWFKAWTRDDSGEFVPRLGKVELPADLTEFREPRFRVRRIDQSAQWGNQHPPTNGVAWAVRNGLQVCPAYGGAVPSATDRWFRAAHDVFAPRTARRTQALGGGHVTFTTGVPGKVWHKDHPEYFPLVKGERVRNAMYCLSNPGVARVLAEDVTERFDKANGVGYFLFGQVDKEEGQCECEACRRLDAKSVGLGSKIRTAGRFLHCANAVGREVWRKWPSADLRVWAYSTYRTFPDGAKVDPRFKVEYCTHGRCYGHAIDDPSCERNHDIFGDLRKWRAAANVYNTYEYFTCSDQYYCCRELAEAHDIRAYDAMGVRGWKNEWSYSDGRFIPDLKPGDKRGEQVASNWQWIYLTSKMLWDPTLDPHAVLEDVESKYYLEAYPAMKKYHALRRGLWENNPHCMGYPWGDPRTVACLDVPGSRERLLRLLDAADALAKSGLVKCRIGKDREWLERFWIKPREDAKKFRSQIITHVKPGFLLEPIVLDGKCDEATWKGDRGFDRFLDENDKPIPAALATSASFRYSGDELYILIRAKEPNGKPVLPRFDRTNLEAGDSVLIALRPPVSDTNAYVIVARPDGVVFGRHGERDIRSDGYGTVAKGDVRDGGWSMEIKIPLRGICPLQDGDTWLVTLGRMRPVRKGQSADWATRYMLDGASPANQERFRPMPFGARFLPNGDFSVHDTWKPKESAGWYTGTDVVLPEWGGGQFPGTFHQLIDHGSLAVSDKTRPFRYKLMAQGRGKISVARFCYDHKPTEGSPHGTGKLYKHAKDAVHSLDGTMQLFEGRIEIEPWERTILILSSPDPVQLKWVKIEPEEVQK